MNGPKNAGPFWQKHVLFRQFKCHQPIRIMCFIYLCNIMYIRGKTSLHRIEIFTKITIQIKTQNNLSLLIFKLKMPSISKEFVVIAGVSVGSLLVGGVFGYYISHKVKEEDVRIVKATSEFASLLDKYVVAKSLREPEILAELRTYTVENVSLSVMITDAVEAQLFRILLSMLNARKCIEVGTYTGYNALNMALSIPSDGVVYALDISEDYVNHGRPFFEKAKVSKKIDIRIGPGLETMDSFIKDGQEGSFDFIFIDADKCGYDMYYEKGLLLLRPGGMIALDNMFQSGRVLDVEAQVGERKLIANAINDLNQKLKNDNRVEISLLKIGDGVTLCLKL